MPCLLWNHGDHNVFVWFVRCFWNSWSASIKARRKGAFMRGWKMCRRGDRRSVFRLPPPPTSKLNVYMRVPVRKGCSCVQIICQSFSIEALGRFRCRSAFWVKRMLTTWHTWLAFWWPLQRCHTPHWFPSKISLSLWWFFLSVCKLLQCAFPWHWPSGGCGKQP